MAMGERERVMRAAENGTARINRLRWKVAQVGKGVKRSVVSGPCAGGDGIGRYRTRTCDLAGVIRTL